MGVAVQRQYFSGQYAVYVYREINGIRYVQQANGPEFEVQRHSPNPNLKPTFLLDEEIATDLIEALQREGVQPKQLTLIEGQYDAQGKHLADLQNILKTRGFMK